MAGTTKSKHFIFREIRKTGPVTLRNDIEVVDIVFNEEAISPPTNRTESSDVFVFTYEETKTPVTSMFELELRDKSQKIPILRGLARKDFRLLRRLTESTHLLFKAKITSIQSQPFALTFAFDNRADSEDLGQKIKDFEVHVSSILSKCVTSVVSLSLRLLLLSDHGVSDPATEPGRNVAGSKDCGNRGQEEPYVQEQTVLRKRSVSVEGQKIDAPREVGANQDGHMEEKGTIGLRRTEFIPPLQGKDMDCIQGPRRGSADSIQQSAREIVESTQPPVMGNTDSCQPSARGNADSIQPSVKGNTDSIQPSVRGNTDSCQPSAKGNADSIQPSVKGNTDSIQPSVRGNTCSSQPLVRGNSDSIQLSKARHLLSTHTPEKQNTDTAQPSAKRSVVSTESVKKQPSLENKTSSSGTGSVLSTSKTAVANDDKTISNIGTEKSANVSTLVKSAVDKERAKSSGQNAQTKDLYPDKTLPDPQKRLTHKSNQDKSSKERKDSSSGDATWKTEPCLFDSDLSEPEAVQLVNSLSEEEKAKWASDPRVKQLLSRYSDVKKKQLTNSYQEGLTGEISSFHSITVPNNTSKYSRFSSTGQNVLQGPSVLGTRYQVVTSEWDNHPGAEGGELMQSLPMLRGAEMSSRIQFSVDEAMRDHVPMPPRARGTDTVLCLDTSSSLGPDGFKEVKDLALEFIDGIEDICAQFEMEENIGIVTFGGRSKIQHHLSNDYSSLRETIDCLEMGGQSPLYEALIVCLCCINGRGGALSVSGVHRIQPRLIIITDGRPSDISENTNMDVFTVDTEVKMNLLSLLRQFSAKENQTTHPRPVTWVPAGQPDETLLGAFAKMCKGNILPGKNIRKLCHHQRIQTTVGKVFCYLQQDSSLLEKDFDGTVDTLINVFASELEQADREEVRTTLQGKIEFKDGYGNETDEGSSFSDVTEIMDLPPLGTRVVRGPDWSWENQDTDGPGTIVNHDSRCKGTVSVIWDNGTRNTYRFGVNNLFDLCVVNDQPRFVAPSMLIEVGCEVNRGPDWKEEYGCQDGGPGGVGVVIRKNDSGLVKVRWKPTCFTGDYRFGSEGKMDLAIRDPVECLIDLHNGSDSMIPTATVTSDESHEVTTPASKRYVWKWQDDGQQWHTFPLEVTSKLEDEFAQRPTKSCVVECGVKSYRILFKDMQAKDIKDNTKRPVKRCEVED